MKVKESNRHIIKQIHKWMDRLKVKKSTDNKHIITQIHKWMDRQMNRLEDRWMGRQKDEQTV